MKFGHFFKECLRNEGFPPEWIDSAISYSQLKKCINRLTHELAQVGLDPATLSKLLKHVEDYNAAQAHETDPLDRPFEYILSDDYDPLRSPGSPRERKPFQPKLLFYVNENTGELHSAKLDEGTKSKLQLLAVETGMTSLRVFEETDSEASVESADSNLASPTGTVGSRHPGFRTVEVPLTSDTEFFTRLTSALSADRKSVV